MTTKPRRDGPPARLSAFAPCLFLAAAISMAPCPVLAGEDFFEAALGLDYLRDIGTAPSREPTTWPGSAPFPGFAPWHGADSLPALGGALGSAYENLIRKTGDPGFAHGGFSSVAEARMGLIPGMDIRTAVEKRGVDRRIGDATMVLDQGGRSWEGRTAVAFPVWEHVTPMVGIGWNSEAGREHALVGLALRGRGGPGISWSVTSGRRSLDFPLRLDLPEYRPMPVPFQLRQDFHGASLAVRRGPAEIAWSGRIRRLRRAGHQADAYALTDSGSLTDQSLGLALSGRGPGGIWRGEAGLESGSGRHHFRGTTRKGGNRYQFGYLQSLQRSLSARGGLRLDAGRRRYSVLGGASAVGWNAYRPDLPSGRHFWDRNNVLDSYEGSVLGVFNRETWLFDGEATLLRFFAGTTLEGSLPGGLEGRLGLIWQRLDLSARSHVTKRSSTLLIAFTEEEIVKGFPGMTAHLITPDLVLTLPLGGAALELSMAQAIPVSVRFKGEGGTGGGGGSGSSRFSGGTRAGLSLRWGMP